MALSALTSLTQEQYRALNITSFEHQPSLTKTGDPDPDVQIALGGWVGDNVMAFTISNAANTDSGIGIDPVETDTMDINVVAGINPAATTTYWTVNCGTDNKTSDWSLSYAVSGTDKTGKWIFTKGKVMDGDIYGQ